MTQMIIVEKTGTVKEITCKQFDVAYLSKKAGFKTSNDFEEKAKWNVNDITVYLFGKTTGRAGQENKYDFPPPVDNTLFFGSCLIYAKNKEQKEIELSVQKWKIIYEKLFGGFEDIGDEDSDEEDSEDEDDDLSQTKQGYAKDGFVVDDEEDEIDEEEEDEDEDDVEDEIENDDDDEDGEEEDEIDEEEVPKRRVQPKRRSKKDSKVQTIFTMEKQEEDYINCESELSEEEYI